MVIHCGVSPNSFCGNMRKWVISCFLYLAAAALAERSLWPVRVMMCLKFKLIGHRGSCCLVLVLLMGERQRWKGTETPGETANKKRMKNIMWWKQREKGGNEGLWTAAHWTLERFLVSPESLLTLGSSTHPHTHTHTYQTLPRRLPYETEFWLLQKGNTGKGFKI